MFEEPNVTNQLFPIPGSSFPLILRYCDELRIEHLVYLYPYQTQLSLPQPRNTRIQSKFSLLLVSSQEIFPWKPAYSFAYVPFESFGPPKTDHSGTWHLTKFFHVFGDTANGHFIPVFYWRAIVYVLMTCCWHGYRHGNSHNRYRASVALRLPLPNPSERNNTLCLKTELTYSVIFGIFFFLKT